VSNKLCKFFSNFCQLVVVGVSPCDIVANIFGYCLKNRVYILAFEGDSQVVWFEGNFSDYGENKKKRMGDLTPKRIRYKNLK